MAKKSSPKAKPEPAGPPDAAKAEKKRVKQVKKLEMRLADARAVRTQVDALVRAMEERLGELRGGPKPADRKSVV